MKLLTTSISIVALPLFLPTLSMPSSLGFLKRPLAKNLNDRWIMISLAMFDF
jgi:hypothetical protein